MAVYTELEHETLAGICRTFGLGDLQRADGIPQGSINTNYALQTARGRFFLRHTTVRGADDLRFEAGLLAHLQAAGIPGPSLRETTDGRSFVELKGGRASIFDWLEGTERGREDFEPAHARELGAVLGRMHRATRTFGPTRANPYGPDVVRGWLEGLATVEDTEVRERVPELVRALDASTRAARTEGSSAAPPRGVIHADLFMDNVKWRGDLVSAFFDFEMACTEALALDVAITLNAWCFVDGRYVEPLCRAFFEGYTHERPLEAGEAQALFDAAVFGAVRYTVSRIRDFHLSALPADRLTQKSFRTYLARVRTLGALGPDGFARLLRND